METAESLSFAGTGCPGSFNCSTEEDRASFDIGYAPTGVSVLSSLLSCLGSLLIFVVYYVLPRGMRTGVQKIITLLAVADLVTGVGYLFAAGNFLSHYNERDADKCATFQVLCEIQSFVTTWSSLCSFAWTNILAIHFYLKIVRQQTQQRDAKLLPLYNIIAWAGPLLIMVPLLATGQLGYSPYVASNWCYVKDENYNISLQRKPLVILILLVAGDLWILITFFVAAGLYFVTSTHLRIQRQYMLLAQQHPGQQVIVTESVEKRLLYIPLVFIFLRIWGVIQFFFSIAVGDQNVEGCIPTQIQIVFLVLGILQAAGDGGQGWGNALLYVFLSQTMRAMLFRDPCVALMAKQPDQNGPDQNGLEQNGPKQNCPKHNGPEGNAMLTAGAQQNGSNTTAPQGLTKRKVRFHPSQNYSKTSECGPSDEGCHPTPLAAATPSCETITSSMSATGDRSSSESFSACNQQTTNL